MKYEICLELGKIIHKLYKKDLALYKKLKNKINEIISSDNLNNYENLKYPLNRFKRVHIIEQFVLIFQVDTKSNLILFVYFDCRKNIYKNFKFN
jgi:mRNA-degrading endonuclease RelE of RelBE toxin-antitoxin system